MSKEKREEFIRNVRKVRQQKAINRIAIIVVALIIIVPIILEIVK